MRAGCHTWVRPMVWSGAGICSLARYVLTVPTPTPRYAATSLVVHHSAFGSGFPTSTTLANYLPCVARSHCVCFIYALSL